MISKSIHAEYFTYLFPMFDNYSYEIYRETIDRTFLNDLRSISICVLIQYCNVNLLSFYFILLLYAKKLDEGDKFISFYFVLISLLKNI